MADVIKKVKVKFLVHVMSHKPGDEAEVSEADAKVLCTPTAVDKGGVLVEVKKAMLVEDWEKAKTMKVDMTKITQHELEEMGRKNIVPTPIDKAFEAKLAKLKVAAAPKDEEAGDEDEDQEQDEKPVKAARK